MAAAEDKKDLKVKQDELDATRERLVDEHLASASVRGVLAPLEREVDVLKEKLGLLKDEKKDEGK